jgi:RimJ/RimL family protein N-acetyltransferase
MSMGEPTPPTLIALPEELRGERVLLRPPRLSDAEAMLAAVEESREHLRPWVAWVDDQSTIEQVRDYCVHCAARWLLRTDLTFGIFDAETGRYLGGTGLHEPDWELRRFEIGYWIRASATGNGFTTEAVRILRDFAFSSLDARRLELSCDVRNAPSRRVAERNGFVLEGTLRNAFLDTQDQPANWLVFSLVPEDWERIRSNRSE